MMLAVPAGAGGCGHQNFLQDRSLGAPPAGFSLYGGGDRDSFLPELPASGHRPQGGLVLFLNICGSFSVPQDVRPCPELGMRDLKPILRVANCSSSPSQNLSSP